MERGVSTTFAVEAKSITSAVSLLTAAESNRLSITITNRDTADSVYIAEDSGLTAATGYEIGAGESFTIETRAEIWVIGTAAEPVDILKEYA